MAVLFLSDPARGTVFREAIATALPDIACQTRPGDGARHVIAAIQADPDGQPIPGLVDRTRGY